MSYIKVEIRKRFEEVFVLSVVDLTCVVVCMPPKNVAKTRATAPRSGYLGLFCTQRTIQSVISFDS